MAQEEFGRSLGRTRVLEKQNELRQELEEDVRKAVGPTLCDHDGAWNWTQTCTRGRDPGKI